MKNYTQLKSILQSPNDFILKYGLIKYLIIKEIILTEPTFFEDDSRAFHIISIKKISEKVKRAERIVSVHVQALKEHKLMAKEFPSYISPYKAFYTINWPVVAPLLGLNSSYNPYDTEQN